MIVLVWDTKILRLLKFSEAHHISEAILNLPVELQLYYSSHSCFTLQAVGNIAFPDNPTMFSRLTTVAIVQCNKLKKTIFYKFLPSVTP